MHLGTTEKLLKGCISCVYMHHILSKVSENYALRQPYSRLCPLSEGGLA